MGSRGRRKYPLDGLPYIFHSNEPDPFFTPELLQVGLWEHTGRKAHLHSLRHPLPGLGAVAQQLGPACRVVRCQGEVFAPTAQGALEKLSGLAAACNQEGPAWLHLPTGEKLCCWVSRFGYTAQGDGRVLSYQVEFVEERAPAQEGAA